jgi:hypothetical protein
MHLELQTAFFLVTRVSGCCSPSLASGWWVRYGCAAAGRSASTLNMNKPLLAAPWLRTFNTWYRRELMHDALIELYKSLGWGHPSRPCTPREHGHPLLLPAAPLRRTAVPIVTGCSALRIAADEQVAVLPKQGNHLCISPFESPHARRDLHFFSSMKIERPTVEASGPPLRAALPSLYLRCRLSRRALEVRGIMGLGTRRVGGALTPVCLEGLEPRQAACQQEKPSPAPSSGAAP